MGVREGGKCKILFFTFLLLLHDICSCSNLLFSLGGRILCIILSALPSWHQIQMMNLDTNHFGSQLNGHNSAPKSARPPSSASV